MSGKFHEILQYQFHENLSNGFPVMYTTYVQMYKERERGGDRWTEGTWQAFRRFAKGSAEDLCWLQGTGP
jgi:hypothetical protein